MNATDPRDRINPVLGHPLASTSSGLIIDRTTIDLLCMCSLTRHSVYHRVQGTREGPWILTSVAHATSHEVEGRVFPSWVPGWNQNTAAILRLLAIFKVFVLLL